jgi:hypothetical protein
MQSHQAELRRPCPLALRSMAHAPQVCLRPQSAGRSTAGPSQADSANSCPHSNVLLGAEINTPKALSNVFYWHLADIPPALTNVRYGR